MNNTSNTDEIHSCVKPQKQNYSVQATYIPSCLKPLITKLHIAQVELHKTNKLPPTGKEYLCFQINSKSTHSEQCAKSRILNQCWILWQDWKGKWCYEVLKYQSK